MGSGLHYIDLAGGLPLASLEVDRLVAGRAGDRIFYTHATTNTSCCYLLSRPLVARFMAEIALAPSLRLVNIDWMINAILMRLRAAAIACDALHFDPPIFGHGSLTGDYASQIQAAL